METLSEIRRIKYGITMGAVEEQSLIFDIASIEKTSTFIEKQCPL